MKNRQKLTAHEEGLIRKLRSRQMFEVGECGLNEDKTDEPEVKDV